MPLPDDKCGPISGSRRPCLRTLAAAAVLALGMALSSGPAAAKDVLVFAAASLKTALDDIIAGYHPADGTAIKASYAASSTLARQIEQGAEADIFFSADLDWMDYLQQRRLIRTDTRTSLLGNTLVLIAPAASPVTLRIVPGFPLAAALGDGRLAMGDPRHVPAGRYGKAALESLGVWQAVERRIAPGDSVRAALALVSLGEVPLGIVYRTDAAVRVVDTFPADSHPPIIYPVALTAESSNPAAAAFFTYLTSPEAMAVFTRYGFTVLPSG